MAETEVLQVTPPRVLPGPRKSPYPTGLSLLGLTSGIASVDSAIGGLKRGDVALITGPGVSLQAAERYCIRAQLSEARGGLGGGAFFVDGGNSFDVYLFTALAHEYHLDYQAALEGQLISRAFTIYELRSLIEGSLPFFASKKPQILVVSEIFSLFTEDVDADEARRVAGHIASSIRSVSERDKVPILITSTTRPALLAPLIEERCNVSLDIAKEGRWIRSRLFKHPWKGIVETVTETELPSYNQCTLETEVFPHG